jgi:hypothetical protein
LGIGDIFDIGRLTEAKEDAERALSAAKDNRDSAESRLIVAQVVILKAQSIAQDYENLESRLHQLTPPLQLSKDMLEETRSRMSDIVNNTFDLSIFLGGLAAKTSPWGEIRSASRFAAVIVKLQALVETDRELAGMFITHPEMLDPALLLIADSEHHDSIAQLM